MQVSPLAGFSIGTATNSFVPPTLAAGRTNATIYTGPETLSSPCGRHRAYEGSTLPWQGPTMLLLDDPWLAHFGALVSPRVLAPEAIRPANHSAFDLGSKAYQALALPLSKLYVDKWTEVALRPCPSLSHEASFWLSPATTRTTSQRAHSQHFHIAIRLLAEWIIYI